MKPLKAEMDALAAVNPNQEARIRVIADRWADLEANWDDVLDVIG